MANIFKDVQIEKVPSNNFNMTHDHKTSCKMGELVPVAIQEVLPGDEWTISHNMMLRLAPLVAPVMHMIDAYIHTFFVPNRILWSEWDQWISGESTAAHPTIQVYTNTGSGEPGTLQHYLGHRRRVQGTTDEQSAFPYAAYLKIYDEYYRDQNLQETVAVELVAGGNSGILSDAVGDYGRIRPLKRAWQHDYFTSALPFAQKGDPVQLPLLNSTTSPVELTGSNFGKITKNGVAPASGNLTTDNLVGALRDSTGQPVQYDPDGNLTVDINGDAVNIATLRRAFRMQEFLEKDARGGTRYIENIMVHFGVISKDARLQRPEYICGMQAEVQISEVLATAQSSDDGATAEQVVGQQAGHGLAVGGGNKKKYYATEHGVIMSIMSIRPKTAYYQGLHKMYSRNDRFDYAFPAFAHIGEQPVLNKEVYANLSLEEGNEVFGYVPQYADYKYQDSKISGMLADENELEYWHLGRKFSAKPVLNESFIECVPDPRIFADQVGDHVIGHILNNFYVRRKLPVFGNPTI